jgi:hypothetical protein
MATCTPSCSGKECGDDGCGGTCASCPGGYGCQGYTCVQTTCVPSCSGKQCGDDGCGSQCGYCSGGQTCNTSTGQCQGGTTVGGSCSDVIACVNACSDEPCKQACLAAGSALGQSEFMAYSDCLGTYGCSDGYCVADNCAAQAAACWYDGTGFDSCYDVLLCQNGCSGATACINGCTEAGSAAAQSQLVAVNACVNAACPQGDPTCAESAVSGACATHWDACIGAQ